jgi:hypothetical protein
MQTVTIFTDCVKVFLPNCLDYTYHLCYRKMSRRCPVVRLSVLEQNDPVRHRTGAVREVSEGGRGVPRRQRGREQTPHFPRQNGPMIFGARASRLPLVSYKSNSYQNGKKISRKVVKSQRKAGLFYGFNSKLQSC